MRKLLEEIIQNLEVDKLDSRSCLEGIYYIDYLIEMERDIRKEVAYFQIKASILGRLTRLNQQEHIYRS